MKVKGGPFTSEPQAEATSVQSPVTGDETDGAATTEDGGAILGGRRPSTYQMAATFNRRLYEQRL